MSYDDMPAGPEMDRLIAGKVMGWTPHETRLEGVIRDGWNPSTDIAHAWEVVEILSREWIVSVSGSNYGDAQKWRCSLVMGDGSIFGEACPTAPLAICRAALKAMGAQCP